LNKLRAALIAAFLLLVALWLLTPGRLEGTVHSVSLPADLDAWLAQSEAAANQRYGLVPGTEKRITWFGQRQATPYSIVYLHGFSATRQETAPLAALVAEALGANLFETRLTGHGRRNEPLVGVQAENWLDDAIEAITVASRLGKRVVLMGTSTGATLTAAILDHPVMQSVDTIVMVSPNFAPLDANAPWLTRPAGPLLARALTGGTRSWQPHNERQGLYWSTSYPTTAAVEMMRLVDLANRQLPAAIPQRLLMFYSPDDEVISAETALAIFERTEAPQKLAIEIKNPGDPSHHVLAGDVLSAAMTDRVAAEIVNFIRRPAP
jgi:esterase/lipase